MKPVEIPLDVELEDRVLWQFTLRQLVIVGAAGLVGWAAYRLAPESWPFPARLLAFAIPPGLGGLLALLEVHGRPLYAWLRIAAVYLFLLTKSRRYRYDAAAIAEACRSGPSDVRKMLEGRDRMGGKHKVLSDPFAAASRATNIGRKRAVGSPSGRNRRSVWTVATQSYRGAHFATFPTRLVEPCVLAGSPPGGLVLDPFAGAGTALLVAAQLGRQAIGVEANPRYCRLARRRIEAAVGPSAVSRASQPLEAALA